MTKILFFYVGNFGIYNCKMHDMESCFGGAHWQYPNMKYNVSLQSVVRFYASLVGCDVPVDKHMAEVVPELEALHILRRKEDGSLALDIPAMPFDESKLWKEEHQLLKEKKCKELWKKSVFLKKNMAAKPHLTY